MARNIPIDSPGPDGHFFIESRRGEVPGADAVFDVISPGYFTAMRIPLLRGRDFSDEDTEVSQPVAIVSAEMARAYFADGDPIGQRIWFDPFEPQEHWATIVGVVGDVREGGVAQRIMPAAYANFAQLSNGKLLNGGTLVVRTGPDPAAISSALRSAVIKANADAAPAPKTMNAVMSASLAKQRFQIQILGGFAVLALLLAAVGLYGVLSHLVTANRLEIGIRMALGASRAILFRGIAGRALGLAALGVAAGLAGCYAMGRVMASMLFGVGVGDPVTLGAASLVLLVAAFVAASFPARRATRVDPMVVLRDE
jgi:putative ABC transport system permease protein